jgi:PAS domain-containing protein
MTEQDKRATSVDSPDDALDMALGGVVRRTGASAGSIHLLEDVEPVLRLVAMAGLPAEIMAPFRRVLASAPLPGTDAIQENRLVWVGSHEELARRYPRVAVLLPYRMGVAAIPLNGAYRCWGALLLFWPASHTEQITRRERRRIATSARAIGRLLDEAEGRVELPEYPRVVPIARTRADAPQSALAAADFAERLPGGSVALDLQGRITFVTDGAVRLLGRSAGQLLGSTPLQSLPWLNDPVYMERYRTAVLSREPVAFTALRPLDNWLTFQLYPDSDGISVRLAPVPSAAGAAPPTPADTPDVLTPAAATAPAGRIYQLMHLAATLTETVGVNDVIDLIADQVLPAFEAQSLMLSEAEAGRLKVSGSRGYSPQVAGSIDGLPLDPEISPAGQALASGIPAFYASREEMEPVFPDTLALSDKQAWAFLPLVISGRPVGCCIISYDHPHDFTQDERAVLTSLAGLLAQAVDRARLYDAKNQLARDLQRALLPRKLPVLTGAQAVARYLPVGRGLDIGGDFYDVIRLTSTTCAAVIGDVQGHNTAAAALMGEIRAAVHATAGAPPEQVLTRVNKVVNDLDLDLLASCLYVHLDLENHHATIASAGHPPPLLRDHDGCCELLSVEPGPLLGIGDDAAYPSLTLPLPEDAVLALYTDGLVEVPGVGTDRTTADLADHLGRTDISDLDELIDGLIHCSWPVGQHTDDITVLLLRTMAGIGG